MRGMCHAWCVAGGIAIDGWRDIAWFDQMLDRVAASGQGELCFVSGNNGAMLDQIRRRANDAPFCIGVGPTAPAGSSEVRAALVAFVGTVAGLINPLGELVLLAGELGLKAAGWVPTSLTLRARRPACSGGWSLRVEGTILRARRRHFVRARRR